VQICAGGSTVAPPIRCLNQLCYIYGYGQWRHELPQQLPAFNNAISVNTRKPVTGSS
jgi:hypothetical protein